MLLSTTVIQGLMAWISTQKCVYIASLYWWYGIKKTFMMCLNKLNSDNKPKSEGHIPVSATEIWCCHWIQLPK